MVLPEGYKFVKLLGEGGQSFVELAKTPNQELVAVKHYNETNYDIFLYEILGLKLIGLYIDHIVIDDMYYLIMKPGDFQIYDWMNQNSDPELLSDFYRDVIQQLAVCQQHGLIHCDVKMHNVIYTNEPFKGDISI